MGNFFNSEILIHSLGYVGIFSIIFVECGVFFGFFLPGDTLLFSAGFLASQGYLNIWILLSGLIIVAYLGAITGYLFGKKVGHKIFSKKESFFFNPKNLERTRLFYEKYGKWTIVLCRFVPIVRTFAPILAGVGEMNFETLLKYNILGSFFWPALVLSVGYFFGSQIPSIHKYMLPAMGIIFLLVLISMLIPILKEIFWKKNNKIEKNS